MSDKQTGLIIHHDIRNENFLAKDGILRKASTKGVTVEGEHIKLAVGTEFKPKTKSHRQYKYFTQNGPKCTAFGTLMYLATARPYNKALQGKRLVEGNELYDLIRLWDRSQGWVFDEGATVNAALETARSLGWVARYEWLYTIRSMQEAILIGPLVAGIYWYDSMFDRDAEGIVIEPRSFDTADSGHFITIRKYDARRDIWWCPNTWGDGDYGIPGNLMHRLIREEGEIAIATEIDVTP